MKLLKAAVSVTWGKTTPPLQIVSIEIGCEGYSPHIYSPAKLKVTGSTDKSTQRYFTTTFNAQYQNISNYGMWYKSQLATLTEEKEKKIGDCSS